LWTWVEIYAYHPMLDAGAVVTYEVLVISHHNQEILSFRPSVRPSCSYAGSRCPPTDKVSIEKHVAT
jgi:hypothetical protein